MKFPKFIAHADWGTDPKKRQVATAELTVRGNYRVYSLAPADPRGVADGDLRRGLHVPESSDGQVFAGFDFPIGIPRAYAKLVGVDHFTKLLPALGFPPWDRFFDVDESPSDISPYRPFYPARPGGTSQAHLFDALGLARSELRRRCEGTDAETMFWTLGGKQVGKAALAGWRYLMTAAPPGSCRLWPFEGPLDALLDGRGDVVVAETYPREFYQHIKPPNSPPGPWSKRRRLDRLQWMPQLLLVAMGLGVDWDPDVQQRVENGFSDGVNGEDEFDAMVGLLGMIGVVQEVLRAGVPRNDPAVETVEGWILGRRATAQRGM